MLHYSTLSEVLNQTASVWSEKNVCKTFVEFISAEPKHSG